MWLVSPMPKLRRIGECKLCSSSTTGILLVRASLRGRNNSSLRGIARSDGGMANRQRVSDTEFGNSRARGWSWTQNPKTGIPNRHETAEMLYLGISADFLSPFQV
jgi:hypothetical protein